VGVFFFSRLLFYSQHTCKSKWSMYLFSCNNYNYMQLFEEVLMSIYISFSKNVNRMDTKIVKFNHMDKVML
jgi:hypothetical protein